MIDHTGGGGLGLSVQTFSRSQYLRFNCSTAFYEISLDDPL